MSCGDKTGPLDWEKDLDRVWYREHCEYHVMFSHAAGCGNEIPATVPEPEAAPATAEAIVEAAVM